MTQPQDRADHDGAVAETIRSLYLALGDRAAFDAHLAEDITIWESDAPDLIDGVSGLDALRDERAGRASAADSAAPAWVAPEDIRVDRWAEAAVARFVLRAHYPDREDETFRVTDVLTPVGGRWKIVHHHAERYPHS
ncbi:nuclear transport factor 2 family protein [Ruania alkalisoli]|uniref:Nuclear transport factor 2 family protein n=1 Tax=Ruania alkalisoli TaxID=2779775 RepID=A0A7M1STR6_9MICO|nr:nuclear transport factor 2 family protein [Ruania alkalisoli]QOR70966.1 nuclear transport factor 2 family protein [Ruania alkalisoli]